MMIECKLGVDLAEPAGDETACTCLRCATLHRWRKRAPTHCRACGLVFEANGDPHGYDRRFFDPRPPGHRHRDGAVLVERFNRLHPVGTSIRVWPGARWMLDRCRDTVVASPGAFLNAAGYAVVKIPGDTMALTHVQIITGRFVEAIVRSTYTRDEARSTWAKSGLTLDDLTLERVERLRSMINEHMTGSGCINGTLRARRRATFNPRSPSDVADIRCSAYYFNGRQAVTFERLGFIGFAGWADEVNVQPILAAFVAWVAELKAATRPSAARAIA